jgi:hypothetical protein
MLSIVNADVQANHTCVTGGKVGENVSSKDDESSHELVSSAEILPEISVIKLVSLGLVDQFKSFDAVVFLFLIDPNDS